MNDAIMPTLLSMISKEEAFKDFSRKTQFLIKIMIMINTITSTIKLIQRVIELYEKYQEGKHPTSF